MIGAWLLVAVLFASIGWGVALILGNELYRLHAAIAAEESASFLYLDGGEVDCAAWADGLAEADAVLGTLDWSDDPDFPDLGWRDD